MFDCYPPFLGFPFSTKFTSRQAHLTLGLVEKHSDGQFVLKALKQKLYVDGLCYLLQVLIISYNAKEGRHFSTTQTSQPLLSGDLWHREQSG